jgi:hypothetical protein
MQGLGGWTRYLPAASMGHRRATRAPTTEIPMQAHRPFRAAALCAAALAVCATGVHAQQANRSVRPAAPVAAPSAASLAGQAAPNPAGLRSPAPAGITAGSGTTLGTTPTNPAGLPSPAPAGITAGGGVRPGGTVVTENTTVVAPGVAETTVTYADGSTATTTSSALNSIVTESSAPEASGDAAGGVVAANALTRGPSQTATLGRSGNNPVEVARSFLHADRNADGELSRAEAQRLTLALMTFEEMDRNFDGVVTRSEYEDGMR